MWNDRYFFSVIHCWKCLKCPSPISVLSVVVVLRLMRHKTSHQREWLLSIAVLGLPVLIKIGDFLYNKVILGNLATSNHTVSFFAGVAWVENHNLALCKLYACYTSKDAAISPLSAVEILVQCYSMRKHEYEILQW